MIENTLLNNRIDLLVRVGEYLKANNEEWQNAKFRAAQANAWFTAAHIDMAVANIVEQYLDMAKLNEWVTAYIMPSTPRNVGIIMAGNIPLVGFHDFLCAFVCGHHLHIKLSSKDDVLQQHIIDYMLRTDPSIGGQISVAERLNGCDAYIATGSNNTARYFEQYFGKYPHIIRQNRTSVAILDGTETDEELLLLADDVYLYYGLGCRNVTQICVPRNFDFARLLQLFGKYNDYADLNKYKNNYDYHLAIYLLNRVPYMSNESLLMVENDLPFSAVSVLHYRFYDDHQSLVSSLTSNDNIQAIIGKGFFPFGSAQKPALNNYADGVDTMAFLTGL
jgi:hypothetical protein